MLRTIAGIILGYLIFAVPSFLLFRLTHVDPHAPATAGFEVIAVFFGIAFAILAGYFGTAISARSTMWVALIIAAILAAGTISSMVATGLNWSPISALICMAPAVLVGGWLRLRRQ
jgi:NO-binding membrane sensor protein with MHYT domain